MTRCTGRAIIKERKKTKVEHCYRKNVASGGVWCTGFEYSVLSDERR